MKRTISFLSRLLDTFFPRACAVCGERLSVSEEILCGTCNLRLPRTGYVHSPYDNELVRLFWGLIPIEKGASLFFYKPHSDTSRLIYKLKYGHHPEIGEALGRLIADEFNVEQYFVGITAIVAVPLTKQRLRERGYNQSMEIARGISAVTGIPILEKALQRVTFHSSQTQKDHWQRNENVEKAFQLTDSSSIAGQHILLIDDIITSGATLVSAAQELLKGDNVKLSVLSLGFAKNN
ncbi:phosphoribosyltransferase family protein [uncultured Prevotella sp.]|uniref:ComF family protein n=1 Tax=uncultured Prevotella sp. TaxID=159272 RepID=UPI00235537B4|nr:phosphoribosyltransferase family protein [uncultured Prevotella sp.]